MATNYEQAGIEAVNRLFKPMAEGMDTQQQLQRQAGLLGLQRQTQLDDAATARSQQLSDAEAAQQRGLERITKQAEEQSRLQQEAEERTKNTRTQEMRDELNALYQRIQGKGSANLSFSPAQIKTASFGALSAMMREASVEEEMIKQNRKSHAELFERFQSLAKSEIGREVLLEEIGAEEGDAIDFNEVAKQSKSDLQEIIAAAIPKINSRKYDNTIVKPYKRVLKQQNELLNDTGLGDLLSENRTPVSLEAGPALARDQQFLVELFPNIKDDRYIGDSTQDDYARIIAALNEGDLDAVMGMLQEEGQGALTAYSSAYQRWMQSTAASQTSAQASALQSYLLKNQDNLGKLREVGKIIDSYQQNHPWIQFAVSIEDTVTNKDIQEGRLKAEQRANAGGPLNVAPKVDGQNLLSPEEIETTITPPMRPGVAAEPLMPEDLDFSGLPKNMPAFKKQGLFLRGMSGQQKKAYADYNYLNNLVKSSRQALDKVINDPTITHPEAEQNAKNNLNSAIQRRNKFVEENPSIQNIFNQLKRYQSESLSE
tara:strand:+ start:746 stop:2371 length:1626 start_codon:yes stop_codon:yes gene_type:complete